MGSVDSVANVALALSLLLVAGRLGASAARRLGQPAVLGELLVGIALGNLPAIGVPQLTQVLNNGGVTLLAQLGAMLLLFEVGVEQRLSEIRRLGIRAAAVAACGVTASFVVGGLVTRLILPAAPPMVRMFLAASLTATSVGIGAGVLRDLVRVDTDEAAFHPIARAADDPDAVTGNADR